MREEGERKIMGQEGSRKEERGVEEKRRKDEKKKEGREDYLGPSIFLTN